MHLPAGWKDDKIDPSKIPASISTWLKTKDNYVAPFENEYALRTAIDKNPTAKFLEIALISIVNPAFCLFCRGRDFMILTASQQ